ncbi:excinuclease ABC subunit UvrC [Candidatus Falkowbacteria bacterium]|nr:excinuclease ABC subunit UvrC [Candidatus Falkowbacteria bacterium]
MVLNDIKKLNIPTNSGSYQFYNAKGEIIYIGKAANLKNRVLSYWQKSSAHTPAKHKMLAEIKKIKWIAVDSEIEALLLEANLVKKYQPYYNVLLRDDKRFIYIKISLADEIPGVFLTRTVDKSGKYFGPFISAQAARETIKVIRKIWPYCNMRKAQKRPCFYYQIGRCLGICAGRIEKQEYMKFVIKPIIMFLSGKKNKIIKNYEARIKKLGKNNDDGANNEALSKLRFELNNMRQVLESSRVLSVGEKYANDVVELAKILSLPKIPKRIEGYDIANIFGKEAVGSMVVFSGGEADKKEYRKFKIRLGQGQANDVGMLKEILERRLKHASPQPFSYKGERKNWPLPDLIIIDGGKAQLNAALNVLRKNKLEIPLIAIAKGLGLRSSAAPDKLFFPGEAKALELPLASPTLHLIKRVRDEAHRFAIGYHRKLRSRAKFG